MLDAQRGAALDRPYRVGQRRGQAQPFERLLERRDRQHHGVDVQRGQLPARPAELCRSGRAVTGQRNALKIVLHK